MENVNNAKSVMFDSYGFYREFVYSIGFIDLIWEIRLLGP